MIKILIVEDSPVEQQLLTHVFDSQPDMRVVGAVDDGEHALTAVRLLRPDVVTMDIHMPRLNGFETTRRIMEDNPLPIVVVSGSIGTTDAEKAFHAIEAGALAVVRKPSGPGHPDHAADVRELVKTVRMMSEVKVVRRWPRSSPLELSPGRPARSEGVVPAKVRVVAIGASTGGPTVLRDILAALPKSFPVPVLVVQHMAKGFMESFVAWLEMTSGFPARIAAQGEYLLPGRAYFAPDGVHMLATGDGRVILSNEEPDGGLRPSVARLFRSVAEVFGRSAIGVLLTGMGRDGAEDLRLMRERGAVTVVQDRESSVVFGMPGEAVNLGAADHVLPPERIAELLGHLVKAQ
ncbi:MAG TPA: chemotaxis-specific protein-glutamate methyltransferase CheB [Geobacteraceae bacterium]